MEKKSTLKKISLRTLVPNLITVLALCVGLTGLRYALQGHFELAITALFFAVVLDFFDGTAARLLKGSSAFGGELDSLADVINFGVVPGVIVYLWSLETLPRFGWLAVLVLAVCCALRLARFNVTDTSAKPSWAGGFFTGVPAPAGAGLALLPLILSLSGLDFLAQTPFIVSLYIMGVGLLMVTSIPTVSLKKLRINRRYVAPFLVFVALLIALFVSYRWITLSAIGLLYLCSLPIGALRYKRLEQRHSKTSEEDS